MRKIYYPVAQRGDAGPDEHFDSYRMPRFRDLPELQTILLPKPGLPALGGGEPAMVVMGGLLANAIHDALGVRMLQLPMTPARILKALAAAVKIN